ncbi:MAG TPA: oligosaccharide flippase family protein [Thermoleophilaceae bacterium]|jgi:PST family polysaccharide transporter
MVVGREGAAGDSLRTRTARGTVVNAAFMVFLQTLGLLKGFVIAAFLTRSEYGVWGILVITLGTLSWLKDIGIGDKYVQQDDPDQERAFQRAFSVDLLANGALFGLIVCLLPPLALAYGHWEIVVPGLVLAAAVPVQSFKTPSWIFYRQMRYARQRLLEAVDPVVSLAVTVVLAAVGLGYWSLVIGFLAGAVGAAVVAVAVAPYPLRFRFERAAVREYWSFSWPIFVASASGLAIPQVALLAGTRTLGLAGAGAITLAGMVGTYTDKVDEVVTWTLYPAICRVKDRAELMLEAFVKSNRLALMWGIPFGVGVALFASDVVHYGIGERWVPAIGLIQVFGLTAAANHIGFNWGAFLSARGDTRPLAVTGPIVLAAFLAAPVPLLIAFGLNGFGAGMAFMTAVGLAVRSHYLRRLFPGFRMVPYALRGLAPTVPATAVTLAARVAIPGNSPAAALVELGLYVGVTAACTWALERPLLREVLSYVRRRTGPPLVPSAAA